MKQHSSWNKNSNGFSLVEIMVAIGILSLIAFGVAQMVTSMSKSQKHLSQTFEMQSFMDELRSTVSMSATCATSLGLDARTYSDSMSIASVTMPASGAVAIGPTAPAKNGLIIKSMEFVQTSGPNPPGESKKEPEFRAPPATAAVINYDRRVGSLEVSIAKQDGSSGFSEFQKRTIPIMMMVRPATATLPGRIDYCFSSGDINDQLCTEMFGGDYDETKTPKCRLNRLSVSSQFPEHITNSGVSKMTVEDRVSVFNQGTGNASVMLQAGSATSPGFNLGFPSPLTQLGNSAEITYVHGGPGNLEIRPPQSAGGGTTSAMTFVGSSRLARLDGLNLFLNRNTNSVASPLLNIDVSAAPGSSPLIEANGTGVAGRLFHFHRTDPNANEVMRVSAANSGQLALDVNGTSRFNGNISVTGVVTATSDARLKSNFGEIENPLDKILNLRGLTYDMVDQRERQMGVIAQDVEKSFPEAVTENQNGYLSVNGMALQAATIEAIKEMKKQHDAEMLSLRKEIQSLKKQIKAQSSK